MDQPLFVAGTHVLGLVAGRAISSLGERVASARHCSPADWKLTDCGRWLLARRP
ncbi:hypothetical protein A2U01_0115717 [Trifolium medium]|uniref:Uncharacterized protein n=1 Tax=Trifolium medium TaxID=97028 RepID=A0A392W3S9_9FABA|nr:hypothetical protein [Trifolium medium]